jgi:hypothetical protein
MFSTGAGAFQLIRRPETSRPIETKLGTTDKAKETSRHDKSNAGHPRGFASQGDEVAAFLPS